jgi:hypothetical protein
MPNIQCLTFPLAETIAVLAAAAMTRGPDGEVESIILQTVEELRELLRSTRQSGSAVRFHDEDFYPLVTAWKWEGTAAGLAFITKHGQLRQVSLMLSGLDDSAEAKVIERALNHFGSLAGTGSNAIR